MSEKLTGFCPNCSYKLEFNGVDVVVCPCCDNSVDIASLKKSSSGGSDGAAGGISAMSAMAMMGGFDNPESGIVFMENYFDTLDWSDYKDSPAIEMGAFTEVLENNKMKNGANGVTWYLEFKGLSVPLSKKFEGLKEKEVEMGEKYDPEDSAAAYESFDLYRRIIKVLIVEKDNLLKRMDSAINYASKFKLDADKITEMAAELKTLSAQFEALKEIDNISEIPAYQAAVKANNEKMQKELAAQGIDAESEYRDAIEQYNNSNPDKKSALTKLEKIRGYADSVEYIEKINKYYNFEKLYHFFGKYFVIYKEQAKEGTFDVKQKAGCLKGKKKDKGGEEEVDVLALALHEVVHGVPSEEPLVEGVEELLDTYNNKFYFLKKNKGIYYYDVYTGEERMLDEGKDVDYYQDGELKCYTACNGRGLIITRVTKPKEQKGCLGKPKKKKEGEEVVLNNYCALYIDMMTGATKTIIPEYATLAKKCGDKLFFYFEHKEEKQTLNTQKKGCALIPAKKEMENVATLRVCDLRTGQIKDVLSESCEIITVDGNNVIYTYWKPNWYNKDLRVYNLETGADTLVEDNIYNYDRIIKGRIYYTVGNETYCSLISNNFEGTDRKEVMKNVENIAYDKAGWFYVVKGKGRNRALWKVHSEATVEPKNGLKADKNADKQRILLCPQFGKIRDVSSTHVYYTDTDNNLRVVRTDGKENTEIGNKVTWSIVEEDKLFYCRYERVAEDSAPNTTFNIADSLGAKSAQLTENLSLYEMDKTGHNVRKVVFNVDNAKDYNHDFFYYMKKESLQYLVSVPNKKKDYDKHVEWFNVERYFRYDKTTGKSELVLTIGLPNAKTKIKSGCFLKKPADGEILFEEIPVKPEYKHSELAAVQAEQEYQEEQQQKKFNTPIGCLNDFLNKNSGKGCLGKSNKKGGCLGGSKDTKKKGCLGK